VKRLLLHKPPRDVDGRRRCGQDAPRRRGRRPIDPRSSRDGVWWVDLAPVGDSVVVPVTVCPHPRSARSAGAAPRWRQCSASSTIGKILLLLDQLRASARLPAGDALMTLLSGCPQLTALTTSRETDLGHGRDHLARAVAVVERPRPSRCSPTVRKRARSTFSRPRGEDAELVADICRRLDGMPLAIELAARAGTGIVPAARSPTSLNDRFPSAHRWRQKRTSPPADPSGASVDWSHAPADRGRAHPVSAGSVSSWADSISTPHRLSRPTTEAEQFQILDQLSLLVDKSLVTRRRTVGCHALSPASKRCGSTLSRSSVSQAKPTRCAIVIATTTWRPRSRLDPGDPLVEWGRIGDRQYSSGAPPGVSRKADFETALGFVSSLQRLWVKPRPASLKA